MADFLISPVQEIGKEIEKCILTECLWLPIKPHFDYWWRFHNNIQELRDGIRDLNRETLHISQKIEEARLRTENLCPEVEEWLKASTEKLREARNIFPNDNIPKAWNITSRYSMGRSAKKTAEEIAEVRNNGKFDRISDPAPPPSTRFSSHGSTMDFESRKLIEEDIIQCLRSSSVSMVGICGMGGAGKTTMAKRIRKKVKEENLFDEVVMVTVSQNIDMLKIQEEIAEWLKLKFDDEKLVSTRAAKLRTRLMDSKRKLIILDDVWESLRFGELGIPIESNFERCKVLLTSRSIDTCKPIKNKKVFELKSLQEKEAWILFKEKAGECVEDSALRSVAKFVADECKGLPIAIVTVGLALRDKTNIYIWKNSLSQLRKSNPTDFPQVLRDVYKPLKLSYDRLDNFTAQYLFLLCCLFPEDFDISVEQLTWYSMGLELFDDINNIKEARNRMYTLVEKLKNRFLLIDGKDELHVKMHDVVRDVAIYIGSKEKNGFLKSLTSIKNSSDVNCNLMSLDISNERMEVPVLSWFPKLRLLMLLKSSDKEFSDISFEGMKDLNVLSFQRIRSLPPTLGLLKNLQMLCLVNCEVENISVIGKLTSSKILSCYGCKNITELPAEIGSLSGLRLLELNECRQLQRIPFGVISSLSWLEELKMRGSFRRWEAEENGEERRNASLTELQCLPNLTCLEIDISDCTLSAQEICLSLNLVKYCIRIASKEYYVEERDCEKVMILNLPNGIGAVGKWIQELVRNTDYLSLEGDGSNNFNIAEIKNLRNLRVWNCSTLKKLVETKDCKFGIVFPLLETLRLGQLKNLEEICNRTIMINQYVWFGNLKIITISQCCNLRSLFSVLVARRFLLQLEVLKIQFCAAMEQVFWNEIRDDTDGCIEFPKLKKLTLESLPNLTAFCQGLENITIKFPNLTEMRIQKLPKLKYSVFPLCSETVCNLKSIGITSCPNLRSLFSDSVARRCLLQLKFLCIKDCAAMEQVFWNEIRDYAYGCIEFPKLKTLILDSLPNLTAFCQGLENIIIKFPNLITLTIQDLSKLNSLSPLNSETLDHTTSSLHFVCNPKVEMGWLKDLTLYDLGDNIRNIWCHQIPNKVFNNLEKLDIGFMNGIMSLMSTSIAKNLVSLKYLQIIDCGEMVEVIERDDADKQVVDSNSLFPNLKLLHIEYLHKLKRFWQWNHALELPLLEEVSIDNCPVMETFILGSINTPNIKKIEVNRREIDDQKNLNDIISHIWTESQNMFNAEED